MIENLPQPVTKAKGGTEEQASLGRRPRWPSKLNELRSALIN